MPVFKDQTGRSITLDKTPQRIISLVPSQTELLYDLGLRDKVIGITKFCVHPKEWFHNKTKIGGTKQLRIDIIDQLQPDLIIANKEENLKEQIEELQKNYPVWISDIHNLYDAAYMIRDIGGMTGKEEKATQIIEGIKNSFSQLNTTGPQLPSCYLIWREPYMTIGGDTFIHSMMEAAGFENIFRDRARYPEISIEELRMQHPQLILLSSEPFPFKQKHIDELQPQMPGIKILLVDGEMFSWYGSRLLKSPGYFLKFRSDLQSSKF
jgi:ABC-type Fe3+-hydroxamate transport system substrate-binding protein